MIQQVGGSLEFVNRNVLRLLGGEWVTHIPAFQNVDSSTSQDASRPSGNISAMNPSTILRSHLILID